METTAIRNITLIVTPMRVKKLFSFWTRICWRARRTASKIGMLGLRKSVGLVSGGTAVRVVSRDRRRGALASAATDGGDDGDRRAFVDCRFQAVEEADAFVAEEDVDV